MSELEFASQDIRQAAARTSDSGIFLDLVSGYSEPAVPRGEDTIIPSIAGRVARDRVADYRRIILEGYVIGTSASDFRSKTDTLMSVMDPTDNPATLTVKSGYLGVSGDKTILARVVNMVGGPPVKGPRFQTWSIELESVAPDWS